MKNKFAFTLVVLLLFFSSSGLYAQSSNIEQRIVGTWIAQGITLTFGSDGALSGMGGFNKWAITGNTLVFIGGNNNVQKIDFFITPDGKTLAMYTEREWMVFQKR